MRRLAAFACSSIATVALGLSVALPLSFAQNANSKIEQSTQVSSTDFSHSESASSGSVTLTASWNDPQLGSPTTFHVEGTGGSGKYLFRMDAPSYSNPGEYAFESVADPSRGEWTHHICEQIDGIVGMKPFQMILVFLRHLKYHLEDVSGFAIFPLHHPPPLRLSTRAK